METKKACVAKHRLEGDGGAVKEILQAPSLFQAKLAVFLRSAPSDVISPVSNILLKYISVP